MIYKFEQNTTKKQVQKKGGDPRTNLRITNCCGNCKWFWYQRSHERRGFCRFIEWNKKVKRTRERAEKYWFKTHITNLCDNHKFSGSKWSIKKISEWVGMTFDQVGEIIEDTYNEGSL